MSCTIRSSMRGRRHLEMTLTAAAWIFSLPKTLVLPAVFAWLSVNHGAVELLDRFVRSREHAFANSDR